MSGSWRRGSRAAAAESRARHVVGVSQMLTRDPAAMPTESGTPCPEIDKLVAHWRRIHPAQGLPGRQHFDPADLPDLLPHIWLMDVHRDPWRFRIRLVGTAIVRFAGRDTTGRWCDDAFPGFEQSPAYTDIVTCADRGIPIFRTMKLLAKDDHRLSRRVHLPLASDGSRVDVILSLTRYVRAETVAPG